MKDVDESVGLFTSEIAEHSAEIDVYNARKVFLRVHHDTSREYFSALVHEICNREDLTLRQKYDVLHDFVCKFCELLTENALSRYLTGVSKDLVLGRLLFSAFRRLKPSEEIFLHSEEVWVTEALLLATTILSPGDVKGLATLVLKKFNKLPGWTPCPEDSWGMMRHFQNLTGFIPEKKEVSSFSSGKEIPLRLRYVTPQEVVPKRNGVGVSVVLRNDQYQELLKRPQTHANQRRLKRFLATQTSIVR